MIGGKFHDAAVSALDLLTKSKNLGDLAKRFLIASKVEGKSQSTIQWYSNILSYFSLFARQNGYPKDISQLQADHIRFFLLSARERGLRPASVNCYYRAPKTFFNWLVKEGFLDKSPMEQIKPPKIPKELIKPFTKQQIEDMLLLCSGDSFLDLRNRAIILLFLDTGLRLHELANIQLKDIELLKEIND